MTKRRKRTMSEHIVAIQKNDAGVIRLGKNAQKSLDV
jgi:hypothetical protein